MSEPSPETLKLVALDAEDLEVISTNLQDAVVRVADVAYLPKDERFALLACRFDWVGAAAGRTERCQTGLHFDRVRRVSFAGFDRNDTSAVLNLLSIGFDASEAPGGIVSLVFSGGAGVRLEVECIDAQMRDTGVRWHTHSTPGHACVANEEGEAAASPKE